MSETQGSRFIYVHKDNDPHDPYSRNFNCVDLLDRAYYNRYAQIQVSGQNVQDVQKRSHC